MSDEASTPEETPDGQSVQSLVLDLNFVPSWARQPPAPDPYAFRERDGGERRSHERRPPRDRSERPPRRDGRGRPESGRHERGGPPPSRRDGRGPGGPRSPRRDGPERRGPRDQGRPPRPPPVERLPMQVSFLPGQDRLTAMVADIRAAQHAFPLPELAHVFLTRPEWHSVKFESNRVTGGAYAMEFYLSRISGRVFLDREHCVRDVVETALSQQFVAEVIQVDPPAGNFVCIGRCRMSGTLIGPPNHHAFNAQVELLHRTRFSNMSLDAYRRQIETVRDPELVERWKEEWRTRTVYRQRPPEGQDVAEGDAAPEPVDEKQARAYIMEQVVPKQVAKVHRAVVSGAASRELTDPRLLALLRAAWGREQKFPMTLVRALRGAFKRMGLHIFGTPGGAQFITAIEPKPIEQARVIDTIREVLDWLHAHPGCTRQDLINGIRPAAGDDPEKMGEVLQPLTWLIEKGHVIEFSNFTLASPMTPPAPAK